MKKNSIHILIVASVALCAGTALPFLLGHSAIDTEQQSVKSEVPYCVTSPAVPVMTIVNVWIANNWHLPICIPLLC